MSFQVKNPVLVIGLGGAGSKLASKAAESLNSDCLIISNDEKDLQSDFPSVKVSTDAVINPSVQFIRGAAHNDYDNIKSKIAGFSTIVLVSNLAGKAGAAISPLVSKICKEESKGIISFAIMPFKYEKDRIFNSGISLKRIREDSDCTIVLDNDALLESNPDLSPKQCFDIANAAMMHVIDSLHTSVVSSETNILSTSKDGQHIEESLRDSLKMLYDNSPPNGVKHSMLYVVGGNNIPVGILNSVSNITKGIFDNSVDMTTTSSEDSKVVMLSSIQGMTKFESYDPLAMIPQENTLDWSEPDCSIDCKLDLYQLE